jgi:hypothetical protein
LETVDYVMAGFDGKVTTEEVNGQAPGVQQNVLDDYWANIDYLTKQIQNNEIVIEAFMGTHDLWYEFAISPLIDAYIEKYYDVSRDWWNRECCTSELEYQRVEDNIIETSKALSTNVQGYTGFLVAPDGIWRDHFRVTIPYRGYIEKRSRKNDWQAIVESFNDEYEFLMATKIHT